MRRCPIRLERNHAFPARDRLAGFLHLVVQLGQPLPEIDLGGLELDRLLQPDEGVTELTFFLDDQAEMGIGQGQLRVKPQRF